jgi:hypothetical protein
LVYILIWANTPSHKIKYSFHWGLTVGHGLFIKMLSEVLVYIPKGRKMDILGTLK